MIHWRSEYIEELKNYLGEVLNNLDDLSVSGRGHTKLLLPPFHYSSSTHRSITIVAVDELNLSHNNI